MKNKKRYSKKRYSKKKYSKKRYSKKKYSKKRRTRKKKLEYQRGGALNWLKRNILQRNVSEPELEMALLTPAMSPEPARPPEPAMSPEPARPPEPVSSDPGLLKGIEQLFAEDHSKAEYDCDCTHSYSVVNEAVNKIGKISELLDTEWGSSIKEISQIQGNWTHNDFIRIFNPYLASGDHYYMKLGIGFYVHKFFIEILNKQWRILSQWDTKHTFLQYAENGKYGKLKRKSETDEFYSDLEILYKPRKGTNAGEVRANHIQIKEKLKEIFMDAYETNDPIEEYPDDYFTNILQGSVIPRIYLMQVHILR